MESVVPPRRVLMTGAGGLIGGALADSLAAAGDTVIPLVRRAPRGSGERGWDPARGVLDPAVFAGIDAVIHLGGAGMADRRWTPARKRELVTSRVDSTMLLARTIAGLARRPTVFVSVSAVGLYGDRGDEWLDDSSPPGAGFLSELARAWEAAAAPASDAGVRVVHPRLGLVLTPTGGALAPLVRATRLGAGGPLGSGRQFWSWITLADVRRAMRFVLEHDTLAGAVNFTTASLRQVELARILGRVLGRPAWAPAPRFALRLLLGEMADAMLLASQRVRAAALARAGFRWGDPELEPALRAMLGRR